MRHCREPLPVFQTRRQGKGWAEPVGAMIDVSIQGSAPVALTNHMSLDNKGTAEEHRHFDLATYMCTKQSCRDYIYYWTTSGYKATEPLSNTRPDTASHRSDSSFLAQVIDIRRHLIPSYVCCSLKNLRCRYWFLDIAFQWSKPQIIFPATLSVSSVLTSSTMSMWNGKVPLQIYNRCPDTLWPAIYTASGGGPSTGGFELAAGANRSLEVDSAWNGRVWARTNCTNTSTDTSSGDGSLVCQTGSCGRLDCSALAVSFPLSQLVWDRPLGRGRGRRESMLAHNPPFPQGNPPATLAEFNLAAGVSADQNFVDISIVDGYNIPLGMEYIADPNSNTTAPPPNLVSPACIATTGYLASPNRTGTEFYTNATYPMPYESSQNNAHVGHWCPWSLQTPTPSKPGDGIYPYPDDGITRPVFDPCLSACQKTGSSKDCCSGKYNSPSKCPRSGYSRAAKSVCPDAYSYPYDDSASTFVIPDGGGWSVTFCPGGRSTDILATFGSQISEWAATGVMSEDILAVARNVSFIEAQGAASRSAIGMIKMVVAALVVSGVTIGGLL